MTVTLAKYVVTFDLRPIAGLGGIKGLRQTGLQSAQETIRVAARIPKRGRIVNAATLQGVSEATPGPAGRLVPHPFTGRLRDELDLAPRPAP